jgi:Meiotically Up-regulated Gene 113 (MUG113) protein
MQIARRITPLLSMWRPLTPFEQRMAELARLFPPPPDHPLHEQLAFQARLEGERDVRVRLWMRELSEKLPSFVYTRREGGTNFPVANTLRNFFLEYATRLGNHGPHSLPTSFNVIESFLRYSHEFFLFDLREEREHLLRLDDYLDWYTSGEFPEEPGALMDILPEGVTYSFNFAAPLNDFRIRTSNSELAVFGVSLVRHSSELSMFAVLGESPAYPPDDAIASFKALEDGRPASGREHIEPAADLSIRDRYLAEAPSWCRVIPMVRFDVRRRRYDVRYVHCDIGVSYRVLTDDPRIFGTEYKRAERQRQLADMSQELMRYDSIFSAIATLMFLPVFFIAAERRVRTTTFATSLHAQRASTDVQRALKRLGRSSVPFARDVHCLESRPLTRREAAMTVTPPALEFESAGFWRSLPPGEVGRDENGNAIVGRTWVERTDSWERQGLAKFTVAKEPQVLVGENPGSIYVMRCASHGLDLYKIGRTAHIPDKRAAEISSATGVPTAFEVLAHWEVGDINYVESESHRRLAAYKVNRRREFFRAPLTLIIKTIGTIVEQYSSRTSEEGH